MMDTQALRVLASPAESIGLDSVLNANSKNCGNGLVAFDRQLRVLQWSSAMEEITGLSAAEVLGKNILESISYFRETEPILRQALAGQDVRTYDQQILNVDTGKLRWFDAHHFPILSIDGRILGGGALVTDSTESFQTRAFRPEKSSQDWLKKLQSPSVPDIHSITGE